MSAGSIECRVLPAPGRGKLRRTSGLGKHPEVSHSRDWRPTLGGTERRGGDTRVLRLGSPRESCSAEEVWLLEICSEKGQIYPRLFFPPTSNFPPVCLPLDKPSDRKSPTNKPGRCSQLREALPSLHPSPTAIQSRGGQEAEADLTGSRAARMPSTEGRKRKRKRKRS